jgi:hypothetical protein
LAQAFSYNPLLFPFLGPVEADGNDPLEQIFFTFYRELEERPQPE